MSDALHPVIRGGVAHFPENETDAEAELFTICMPAGFDRFQLEVGERERVEGSDTSFRKPDDRDRTAGGHPSNRPLRKA